jgi:3-oxoacyl-[acyl-carrier-protein] synthase-1
MAVQLAAQKVAAGAVEACIVAGVDSYHDQETLKWLDSEGTLMSAANRNGFPPSEAAGACLIATVAYAQGQDLPIFGLINAAVTSKEPYTINSDGVCIGEGLSDALKGVSASIALPEQAITATYCDLNGQRYRNEEFVYSLLRVQEAFVDAHDYQCPADCWGDVGAASGPLFLALAINAKERGYGKGAYPVTWASSDCGYRSAVLLRLD